MTETVASASPSGDMPSHSRLEVRGLKKSYGSRDKLVAASSEQTARTIIEAMESVASMEGTGWRAKVSDLRMAVKSLHALNYKVVAAGDSYNDTGMLSEADKGILFDAPANVIREFPQFPVTTSYAELKNEIRAWTPRQIG